MASTCPTTEAALQAGLLPAQERRKGHFAKVAGRLKKSFRRPACHAYDYAALIVPTAVCICIGMHAVKRRNRTHEIHNLHKTHRPRPLQNQISVAPAQAGAQCKAALCLSCTFLKIIHSLWNKILTRLAFNGACLFGH